MCKYVKNNYSDDFMNQINVEFPNIKCKSDKLAMG